MDVVNQPRESPPTVDRFLGASRVVALGMALVLFAVLRDSPGEIKSVLSVAAAVLFGTLLPVLFFHPFRVTGLCPPAVLLVAICLLGMWLTDGRPLWAMLLVGFACGIVFGVWVRFDLLARTRRRIPVIDWLALVVLAGGFAFWLIDLSHPTPTGVGTGLLIALVILIYVWMRLFRPLFELCVEAVVWRGYRIVAAGEGVRDFPPHGPVLIIANHACWWDPLFLAKVLPRPITPMMTSAFYDRWFLKPLMVYVFQTIRVADVHIRREAPEIQQAIQALDEGKCVVIFPEGYLRRKEEIPLRRFGRGVWEILKARPQTPVVAGWIEGGWGSYASYFNGPPTKNKTQEGRRPITVGLTPPGYVSSDVLQHHLQTRLTLMNRVSAAREQLGLSRLGEFEWKATDETDNPSQTTES